MIFFFPGLLKYTHISYWVLELPFRCVRQQCRSQKQDIEWEERNVSENKNKSHLHTLKYVTLALNRDVSQCLGHITPVMYLTVVI